MCGRYAQAKDPAALAAEFDAQDRLAGAWPGPDHNVAPTTTVVGVVDRHPRDDDGTPDPSATERSLRPMRWGLIPSWARDESVGNRLINARAESLTSKPAFRRAAASRRCLLPADGWFEWLRAGSGSAARKTPYFMTWSPSSPWHGDSLALAGLWETWRPADADRDAPPLVTATVVTTAAAGPLTEVHHRMPLVMPADRWADWLDPDRDDPTDLLATPGEEVLASITLRQVSTRVNAVRHQGPELLEEVTGDDAEPEQAGLDLEGAGLARENPA